VVLEQKIGKKTGAKSAFFAQFYVFIDKVVFESIVAEHLTDFCSSDKIAFILGQHKSQYLPITRSKSCVVAVLKKSREALLDRAADHRGKGFADRRFYRCRLYSGFL